MTPSPRAIRPETESGRSDRGFVLVGVIIFVLALTILGLSLFSLSSFEAQFLSRSSRNTQTLYDAMSGIEWAKTVLAEEKQLEAVQAGGNAWITRPERVDSVEAMQNGANTGNLEFGGTPVRIRALASDGRGQRRMVEVQFTPNPGNELYRNLIDSYDFIRLDSGTLADPRRTVREGPVRLHADPDPFPNWATDAPGPPPTFAGTDVPIPVVAPFIASKIGLPSTEDVEILGASGKYRLSGNGSDVTFFSNLPTQPTVSLFDGADPGKPIEFEVTGTCVWLLPKGIRIDNPVRVTGTAADRLVIVAGKIEDISGVPPAGGGWTQGIWFFSGIESTVVPVVLVSDAQIALTHDRYVNQENTVELLSIFAKSVRLSGPETPSGAPRYQILRHPPAMDVIIDELAAKGALPQTSGLTSSFIPIPGTWRELDPDYPS